MAPKFSPDELRRTKSHEYALRFVFGGIVALGAFLIGKAFGPLIGGLFLAFPALLPAGLTLIKEHDGRRAAEDDARGATLGSLGLVAFALVVHLTCSLGPLICLTIALLAWTVVSVAGWFLVHGRRASDH